MNHTTVSGKAWEPDVRYTQSGMCVANVSLSIYDGKDKETQKAKYFNIKVIAFKELAESVGNEILQGDRIQVTGRLSEESWQKDGETKRRTTLIAESISKEIGQKKQQTSNAVDFRQFGSDVTEEIPF
jgi:single stranded DNA-binding protein